jgi:hypothetical protein
VGEEEDRTEGNDKMTEEGSPTEISIGVNSDGVPRSTCSSAVSLRGGRVLCRSLRLDWGAQVLRLSLERLLNLVKFLGYKKKSFCFRTYSFFCTKVFLVFILVTSVDPGDPDVNRGDNFRLPCPCP